MRKLSPKREPTNADRIIGSSAIVTEELNPTGTVKVDGKEWRARTQEKRTISVETEVTILAIQGVTLIIQ